MKIFHLLALISLCCFFIGCNNLSDFDDLSSAKRKKLCNNTSEGYKERGIISGYFLPDKYRMALIDWIYAKEQINSIPGHIDGLANNTKSVRKMSLHKLRRMTHQPYGYNQEKWREWWQANKDRLLKEAEEKYKTNLQKRIERENKNTKNNADGNKVKTKIMDKASITKKVIKELGFPASDNMTFVAKREKIKNAIIPYLHNQLNDKETWIVEVKGINIGFDNWENECIKSMKVILHPETNNIAIIMTDWPKGVKKVKELWPYPSAEVTEKQIGNTNLATYLDFPKDAPKISFYQALLAVQNKGIGSPNVAKMIIAYYVLTPEPDWVIDLRGIPYPRDPSLPWIGHMRNFINAENGSWEGADNLPRYEE